MSGSMALTMMRNTLTVIELPRPKSGRPKKSRTSRFTVCLPPDYFERLGAEADKLFKPRAVLAAEFICNYLDALGA